MTDSGPPCTDNPEARMEWMLKRAEWLDGLMEGEDWVADEIEKHWNYPKLFENGDLHEVPDETDETTYLLFKLALLFGTDYEHYYPRGREGEWLDQTELP